MGPRIEDRAKTFTIREIMINGIVTLSGRVENRGEIADAVENAYEAGAKNVRIRLWIDPTRLTKPKAFPEYGKHRRITY